MSDFQFLWGSTSQFAGDFVVQITYSDIYGNVGTSSIIPLKKNETFQGIETDAGMLRFSVAHDHAELVGYEGNDYNITIPELINGQPVTVIGHDVFSDVNSLREIIIPDSITVISERAFYGCNNLRKLSLPKSLLEIGAEAFCGCEKIESVSFPEKIENLIDSAFS